MNVGNYEAVAGLWVAGKLAPYALYEGTDSVNGVNILVESAVGKVAIIQRGGVIDLSLANRVRSQLLPDPLPAVAVSVLVSNEDGSPKFDGAGNALTTTEMVAPEQSVYGLTYVAPSLPSEDDMHCDMCGFEAEQLYAIGDGWYDKVPREVAGLPEPETCFNLRLKQMGA